MATLTISFRDDDNQIWLKDTGNGTTESWVMTVSEIPAGAKILSAVLKFTSTYNYDAPTVFRLNNPQTSCKTANSYTINVASIVKGNGTYTWAWYCKTGGSRTNGCIGSLSLVIEYEDPTGRIYHVENNALVPYQLFHAEGGKLVPYQLYRAENGELVPYK